MTRAPIDYTEYRSAVNRSDIEDCHACSDDYNTEEGLCLYHEGVEAGFRWAAALVGRALEEPEAVAFAPGELERRMAARSEA